MGAGSRLVLYRLAGLALLSFPFLLSSWAVALDPAQAEREARESLRDLMRNQSSERSEPQPLPLAKPDRGKPGRDKPAAGKPAKPAPATGSNLPAICVGCDAR